MKTLSNKDARRYRGVSAKNTRRADPKRVNSETQIKDLKANIQELLDEIKTCVRKGKLDDAVRKCGKVTKSHARMLEVVQQYTLEQALPHETKGEAEARARTEAARGTYPVEKVISKRHKRFGRY